MDRYFLRNSQPNGSRSAELCKRILICVLLYLLLPIARYADAQFETASVLGYVRDSSGQSIAGATVKLINTATDVTVAVTTDNQGQYQFTDVHIGQYKIDAGANGFNETVTDPFTAAVNARQRVDLMLTPGSVSTTVTVTGAATLAGKRNERNRYGYFSHRSAESAPEWTGVRGSCSAGARGTPQHPGEPVRHQPRCVI